MSNAKVKAAVKAATIPCNANTVALITSSMVQDDFALSAQEAAFRALERVIKRELKKVYPEQFGKTAPRLELLEGDLFKHMRESVTAYMLTAAYHYLDRTLIRGQTTTWDNAESCGLLAYMGSKEYADIKESVKIPFKKSRSQQLHTKRSLKNTAYIKRDQKREQFLTWLKGKLPDTEKETTEKSVELKIAETVMRFYRQYKMDKLPDNERTRLIGKWLQEGFDMMGANCPAAKSYYDGELVKIAKK
jgi:hypothetical protein